MIAFAWSALFSWPLFSFIFFRKYALPLAISLVFLGGYLLLPAGGRMHVDLPLLPKLDKDSVTSITAFALVMMAYSQQRPDPCLATNWVPKSLVVLLLIVCLFLSVFGTVLTNMDTQVFGRTILRGHTFYDIFNQGLSFLVVLLPFIVGRMVFSTKKAQETLLKVIVVSALAYSVLALWEVRMAPMLHVHIYGYYAGSFMQQIRADGFRPVVFLGHGLDVALFFTFAVLAAAALFRNSGTGNRWRWFLAMCWLIMVLLLCKTLGVFLILAALLPIALFPNMRLQLIAAACIAAALLTYPVLRSADVVPVGQVLDVAAQIDERRATSFMVRLRNENALLERAMERPVFGWGSWGRSRVYSETGRDVSLTDGSWVIQLGQGGWARYISLYGLLVFPVFCYCLRRKPDVDPICIGLILILCAKFIDFIPNSDTSLHLIWLCAGALTGRLEQRIARPQHAPKRVGYARDFSGEKEKRAALEEYEIPHRDAFKYARTVQDQTK